MKFLASLLLCLLALGAQAQEKLPQLRVGTLKMAALTDPYIAQQLGIFKKHGLDVQLIEFNAGGEAIAAARGGSLDIFLSIPGTVMVADERGFNMVAIFQNEIAKAVPPDSGAVLVRSESPIHSLQDLKGHKLAVSSLHSQNTVSLQMLLKRDGIDLDAITWIEIPFPAHPDILRSKQADAVAAVDPYTTELLSSGAGREIAWYYIDYMPLQPLGAWFSPRGFVEKNPKLIEAFDASIAEAMDHLNADPARARKEVVDFTGLRPELVRDMPMIGWDYHVNLKLWQQVVDMMVASGELQKPHKVDEFISPQMRAWVVQ